MWLNRILPLAATVQAALFVAILVRSTILRPFGDMISWIAAYLQWRQDGSLLAYLWSPHNEHRLALIRLLTALDISFFHVSGLPFIVAATTALFVTAWLVTAGLRRDADLGTNLRPLAWLAPMLLMNSAAVADCAIPINTVYPLALLFIVAALALLAGSAGSITPTAIGVAAAFVAATLASLANAVGLVVWPALLWSAWRGGAKPLWLLATTAAASLYIAFYVHGLPQVPGQPAHLLAPGQLWKMADYLLLYLGLPLSRAPGLALPTRILGALLLAASLIAIMCDASSPRPSSRPRRCAIGLVIAGLAAATLATIGRVDLAPDVKVPLRYALMVAPLHIGLLSLALPRLAASATTAPRKTSLRAAAAIFAALLLCWQVVAGRAVITASDAISATLDRYDAGLREPAMTRVIFPDLGMARRVVDSARGWQR